MMMKNMYVLLAAFFFTISPVWAQQSPSAGDIIQKMQSKLNLTQDQVTAITPIVEKYLSKREELRQSVEDGSTDRDSVRSQLKQLKTAEAQELGQVLSADQVSQWEQMISQHRHKPSDDGGAEGSSNAGDNAGGPGGNGGGE